MNDSSPVSASTAVIDGIVTRYSVAGSGPPLLMFSPRGFGATMASWETHGLYQRTAMLAQLRKRFTCITFDKRESGGSGGRVERVRWLDYANQGIGLLDHAHLAYAAENGLRAVAALAYSTDVGFSDDGRLGPWVAVLRNDPEFAARYVDLDPLRYQIVVAGMGSLLFDRDTVPGAEPEDLLALNIRALIVPGDDTSHAPSAAHYLRECLPAAELWDVPVAAQTAEAAPARVIEFLESLPL
jgi:hypothetical protein